MIRVRCEGPGPVWKAEWGSEGGAEGGQGRRQDKSTGTLRLQGVDGVEEFPGPDGLARTLLANSLRRFKGLIGTLGPGGYRGR